MKTVECLTSVDKEAIAHHYENTLGKLVKCYSMVELEVMEWRYDKAIKNSWKFVPVRVDEPIKRHKYKRGKSATPYQVRWIRIDELQKVLSNMTWKTVKITLENPVPNSYNYVK